MIAGALLTAVSFLAASAVTAAPTGGGNAVRDQSSS